MWQIYKENEETLEISEEISSHISPQLHKSMELGYACNLLLQACIAHATQ